MRLFRSLLLIPPISHYGSSLPLLLPLTRQRPSLNRRDESRRFLEFLHFVWEFLPRQAPGSRRVTEERFGDLTVKWQRSWCPANHYG